MDANELESAEFETEAESESESEVAAVAPALDAARPRPDGVMPAAEALERLARGETLRNVTIVDLEFSGVVPHPVRLDHVRLVRPSFRKAEFAEEVGFYNCTLVRPKVIRRAKFLKNLAFNGSTLEHAKLRALTVAGNLSLDNARFENPFILEGCHVGGAARFWKARGLDWVEFRGCHFAGTFDFRSAHLDEGLVLERCHFEKEALFRGTTICKKFAADTSRFEALLDLSKAKLHDFIYLEGIEQGDRQQFAFRNALAERLLVRPEQLEGRLASEESGDHAGALQEYGLLKRAFESQHRHDAEDWAFYHFKVSLRRSRARTWRRPWTKLAEVCDWLFLDLGCGYGTNPLRAVTAATVMILAFALIYMVGVRSLHIENPPFGGDTGTIGNRVMIGLLTSVAAFTSGFGDLRDAATGWMNLPLIAEALLGTLLWGLFIVAFSRKVIR